MLPDDPAFSVYCEMVDASDQATAWEFAPRASAYALAKLISLFGEQLDPAWRAQFIMLGGGLNCAADELEQPKLPRHDGVLTRG